MVKNHLRDIVGLPRMWVRGRTLQSSARERKEEKKKQRQERERERSLRNLGQEFSQSFSAHSLP